MAMGTKIIESPEFTLIYYFSLISIDFVYIKLVIEQFKSLFKMVFF